MFLQVVFLVALLTFGECQNENECVREIRSLKSDLQAELRRVRKEIAVQSVSREEVEELVEDKATKVSIETLQQNLTAQYSALQEVIDSAPTINSSLGLVLRDKCVTRDEVQEVIRDQVESVVQSELQSIRTELEYKMQSLVNYVTQVQNNNTAVLLDAINPGSESNPVASCKNIPQGKPSGVYWIQGIDGFQIASQQYCDMTRTCCGRTGGWMKVANLDMKDTNQQCPSGFRLVTSPQRSCGRPGPPGCVSTTFPVHGVEYSRVCGKIIGYQDKTPDAFDPYFQTSTSIDGIYADGVSLTYGRAPRKHIWTFASGIDELNKNQYACPCNRPDLTYTGRVPPFIGQDYFCDTGFRSFQASTVTFNHEDPLWDGQGCGAQSTCCSFNNPPWFCKHLPQPTRDNIELRLCGDEATLNEDTPLEVVEIYVQ